MEAPRMYRRGFTLVELAIVLALVSVLATLALPSYQSVVRKSRRAEAQAMLVEAALRQERWRADHADYARTTVDIGVAGPQDRSARYYRIEVVDSTSTTFKVRAEAVAGLGQEHDRQGGVGCSLLQIDQSGVRLPVGCW
jgi:type IV pilus assembly protein PilE